MAQKLALLRSAVGRWIRVRDLPEPKLRVNGLCSGELKVEFVGAEVVCVNRNGDHPLPKDVEWLRIHNEAQVPAVCLVVW